MSHVFKFLLAARQQEITEIEALRKTCELVRRTGILIHCLQSERGLSTIYLGASGQSSLKQWQTHCQSTNLASSSLLDLLTSTKPEQVLSGGSRLYTRIAIALNALSNLTEIRAQIIAGSLTAYRSTTLYSHCINTLIALIFEAADVTVDPTVSRQLLALFNLIDGKEYGGLERANGCRLLASGKINATDQKLLDDLIDQQEQSLSRFEGFCGTEILTQWQALQFTLPLADLERLRRKLLTADAVISSSLLDEWFSACTQRLDGLHQVEIHLADQLEKVCDQRITQARLNLSDQQGLLEASGELSTSTTAMSAPREHQHLHEQRLASHLGRTMSDMLQAQSLTLQSVTAELSAVRAALEDRKLIERAKGLLMAQQHLSEESAYGLLRQKAMDQNCPISEIARAVLNMADLLIARLPA
jgi:hypothetical protein